ncbi:MAG: SUMF1/EgtB/PvdO family nonheme iron enzyme [Leptospiraceae bacterium]|nr:SUMF1/EgtB/PvdO family nonheme iron enzyme [Leptospiraceae bacterium]
MSGNVREWVEDCYDDGYYKQFENQVAIDPLNKNQGQCRRSLRGGSWNFVDGLLTASFRYDDGSDRQTYAVGFRLVAFPASPD